MEWTTRLVFIYVTISDIWKKGLFSHVIRNSNNKNMKFITDEEIISIFIFGILRGYRDNKSIFTYANDHLRTWFPELKDYSAFNYRINRLTDVLPELVEKLQSRIEGINLNALRLIDSCPIIMAKEKRSEGAKVAQNLASKGYCASRNEFFYGVKLHVIGVNNEKSIPTPEIMQVSPANIHDLVVFKDIVEKYTNTQIIADKAYINKGFQSELKLKNNVSIITPIKKAKGALSLNMFEKIESAYVSKVRQPIESLFNWINEKTGIQKASKVRSDKGLLAFIFGRLSAVIMLMVINSSAVLCE